MIQNPPTTSLLSANGPSLTNDVPSRTRTHAASNSLPSGAPRRRTPRLASSAENLPISANRSGSGSAPTGLMNSSMNSMASLPSLHTSVERDRPESTRPAGRCRSGCGSFDWRAGGSGDVPGLPHDSGARGGERHLGERTVRVRSEEATRSGPAPRPARGRKTEESEMKTHRIVSRDEWLVARRQHLAKEKELTRQRDELAR